MTARDRRVSIPGVAQPAPTGAGLEAWLLSVLERTSEEVCADEAPSRVPGRILGHCHRKGIVSFGAIWALGGLGPALVCQHGSPDEMLPSLEAGLGASELLEAAGGLERVTFVDPEDTRGWRLLAALGARSVVQMPVGHGRSRIGVCLLASVQLDLADRARAFCNVLARQFCAFAEFQGLRRRLSVSRRVLRGAVEALPLGAVLADREGTPTLINAAAAELLDLPRQGRHVSLQGRLGADALREGVWTGPGRVGSDHSAPLVVASHTLPSGAGEPVQRLHLVQPATAHRAAPAGEVEAVDALTALMNRRGFLSAVGREVALSRRHGAWCAVLAVDVAGEDGTLDDPSLVRAAGVLQGRLRRSDCLARIATTRFGVLLSRGCREQALGLSAAVLRELATIAPSVRVGVGVALYPESADGPRRLVTCAGTAAEAAWSASAGAVVYGELTQSLDVGPRRNARPEPPPQVAAPGGERARASGLTDTPAAD